MARPSLGERVLARALRLMANKGYGWSKAIELAAESLEPTPPKQKVSKQ